MGYMMELYIPKNGCEHFFPQNLETIFKFCTCHISPVYLPFVDNKSLPRLDRELLSRMNFIIIGLRGKSLKSFSNDYFV